MRLKLQSMRERRGKQVCRDFTTIFYLVDPFVLNSSYIIYENGLMLRTLLLEISTILVMCKEFVDAKIVDFHVFCCCYVSRHL